MGQGKRVQPFNMCTDLGVCEIYYSFSAVRVSLLFGMEYTNHYAQSVFREILKNASIQVHQLNLFNDIVQDKIAFSVI